LLLACRSTKKASPSSSSSAPDPAAKLEGEVVLAAGQVPVKGRLVIGWRTAEEQKEIDAGNFSMKTARNMMERYTAGEEVDFSKTKRVRYKVTAEEAPADGAAVAVLDVDHTFWPTVFGKGKGLQGSTKAGTKGGEIALARTAPPAPAADAAAVTEPCSGPRMKLVVIEESSLSRATEDAPGRRFCAWLPKSWATAPERIRYPLIFMLPGFMSGEMAYLSGKNHAGDRLDAMIANASKAPTKLPEAILIGVDTSTKIGSTYLEDSPTNGPWDTFLASRALPELEKALKGIPKRTGRALIGQSTGGLNALSYGMRHSDLFSAIGSSSPDSPDVELWLFGPNSVPGSRRPHEWIRKWALLESEVGGPGQTTSWAVDWSPNKPSGHFIPFELDTGVVDEGVISRWVAKSPHGMMKNSPSFAEKVKKDLSGRILIIVGKNDEFGLYPTAESFAKELDTAGVTTKFVATEDGHGNGLARLEEATKFVLERLDKE
jgi:pimeloyl-ACP methyl ester carboxylesterase